MPVTNIALSVSEHQYWLTGLGGLDGVNDIEPSKYMGTNGLISALGFLAIILTGTDAGRVSVTADWRQDAPPVDLDSWDEVVEVSMLFDEDQAALFGHDDRDERFPLLDAGSYRVRVHARGRDQGAAVMYPGDNPVEEHLVVAWPQPQAAEKIHKVSDAYGAQIRALP